MPSALEVRKAPWARGLVQVVVWGGSSIAFGYFIRLAAGLPLPASMAFGVPMGLFFGSFCVSTKYLTRALPVGRTDLVRVGVTVITAALITAAVWVGACRLWWNCLIWMGIPLDPARLPRLIELLAWFAILVYLLVINARYVMDAFAESAAERRRAFEAQVAQRDAELRALRSQVDPHFLFNSLNSIAGLIAPDPAKARLMCQMLGDFLRDSLSLGTASRIPLEREVALAEQYLRVERVRFGARLTLSAAVPAEIARVPVPPLILQPLVENAVRHGVATLIEGGTVEILTRQAGARAVIVVSNPRDDTSASRGTGFGLDLVRRRLQAAFGDRASIAVEPTPVSFKVSLTIPIEEGA